MRPVIRVEGQTTILEFDEPEAAKAFVEAAKTDHGFLLTLPEGPKLFSTHSIELRAGGSFSFRLEARVIQAFDQGPGEFGVAFELESWTPGRDAELERKLRLARNAVLGSAGTVGEMGSSPLFQIKAMNSSERMRLAMKAGRTERRILVRDTSAQVLMGLLGNPRLDREDVLQIVKSTQATSAILKRVAEDRRWSSNQEIRTAVVRNPKTPTPLAIQLLETLRKSDLQMLAKSGSARESLRRAALRLYLKRSSGR